MFGFVTHGLLFAFFGCLFWLLGYGGWTSLAFWIAFSIGFLVGGVTYFFREKQLISPAGVDGENISMAWRIMPILISIGFLLFVLWGLIRGF